MADFDLLIVGGGLATARAVKAFREAGADGSVAVVSKDRWVPYHRPPLSKRYLRGEQEREAAFVEQPGFYDEQRVELLLETTVERVLPAEHRVELAGGRALSYGRLLLASGAWPRQLPVPGGDLDGVLTLRTIDNSTAIREAAEAGRQAVVVGAGFIGMEVSASLRELDVAVAQVHRGNGLFDQFGCADLSEFLVELYRTNGVELFLEDEASRLRGNGRVDAVETKGGELLEADFVVAGVGVDPQTAFLDGSGIEVSNGIVGRPLPDERSRRPGRGRRGELLRPAVRAAAAHRALVERELPGNAGREGAGRRRRGAVRHGLDLLHRGFRDDVQGVRRHHALRRDHDTWIVLRREGDRLLPGRRPLRRGTAHGPGRGDRAAAQGRNRGARRHPGGTDGGQAALGRRFDARGRAVEPRERVAHRHALPDEDRRVALRVATGLALAQRAHQVHEVRRLVALEGRRELLVVDPERVGGVVDDRAELVTDPHVLVHRALAILCGQGIPGARLHEGVHDEVGRAARDYTTGPARLRVLRRLGRREVGVRRLEPAGERRGVQGRAELAEILVALGDPPEEEVRIRPDAGDGVDPERVESLDPVLDHLRERILVGRAVLDREPPPGRIDAIEGVGDVLPRHAADASPRRTSARSARRLRPGSRPRRRAPCSGSAPA